MMTVHEPAADEELCERFLENENFRVEGVLGRVDERRSNMRMRCLRAQS